jgi:hypothetical protein
MRGLAGWSLLAAALLAGACSGCNNNNGASPDGSTDTGTETETDTGTETESETDTSTWVSDAGPWEWEDNPPGEDCGPGCRQLTFTNKVKAGWWDVWGDYLVYRPDGVGERDHLFLVDMVNNRRMKIPSIFEPVGSAYSGVMSPTIFENRIYYSLMIYGQSLPTRQLVRVDVEEKTQTILYTETKSGDNDFQALNYLDAYGDQVVSQAGCGTEAPHGYSLCLFDVSSVPAIVNTLIDDDYGNHNSLWDGVLVFTDSRPGHFDITGYDIATQQFVPITDDDYCQFSPRINGHNVVYGDTRFGTAQDCVMGNRNHEAVFVYDLDTQERTQLTNAQWIAGEPDIWNEIVIWMDYRGCANPNDVQDFSNIQIWGYNLETQTEFRITDLPADAWPNRPKATPRIWGYEVYVDMTTISPDTYNSIFVFDLPDGAR